MLVSEYDCHVAPMPSTTMHAGPSRTTAPMVISKLKTLTLNLHACVYESMTCAHITDFTSCIKVHIILLYSRNYGTKQILVLLCRSGSNYYALSQPYERASLPLAPLASQQQQK